MYYKNCTGLAILWRVLFLVSTQGTAPKKKNPLDPKHIFPIGRNEKNILKDKYDRSKKYDRQLGLNCSSWQLLLWQIIQSWSYRIFFR